MRVSQESAENGPTSEGMDGSAVFHQRGIRHNSKIKERVMFSNMFMLSCVAIPLNLVAGHALVRSQCP